jgi:splicing factor 3B subunit 3
MSSSVQLKQQSVTIDTVLYCLCHNRASTPACIDKMHLLNLTLSAPTAVSSAVVGSFSGTKGQEILVVRGSTKLEILKLNNSTGQREYSLLETCGVY